MNKSVSQDVLSTQDIAQLLQYDPFSQPYKFPRNVRIETSSGKSFKMIEDHYSKPILQKNETFVAVEQPGASIVNLFIGHARHDGASFADSYKIMTLSFDVSNRRNVPFEAQDEFNYPIALDGYEVKNLRRAFLNTCGTAIANIQLHKNVSAEALRRVIYKAPTAFNS